VEKYCKARQATDGIARSKRDGTRAETRFGLSTKRTSPFKSAGVSVHSTAGSRGVRISGQQLYRPCSDIQWKAAGYPLHSHLSPSLPLPCVAVCHQIPNALYLVRKASCFLLYLKQPGGIESLINIEKNIKDDYQIGWTEAEERVRNKSEGIISVFDVVGLQNSKLRLVLNRSSKNV